MLGCNNAPLPQSKQGPEAHFTVSVSLNSIVHNTLSQLSSSSVTHLANQNISGSKLLHAKVFTVHSVLAQLSGLLGVCVVQGGMGVFVV